MQTIYSKFYGKRSPKPKEKITNSIDTERVSHKRHTSDGIVMQSKNNSSSVNNFSK